MNKEKETPKDEDINKVCIPCEYKDECWQHPWVTVNCPSKPKKGIVKNSIQNNQLYYSVTMFKTIQIKPETHLLIKQEAERRDIKIYGLIKEMFEIYINRNKDTKNGKRR